jgi:hypothetical protein
MTRVVVLVDMDHAGQGYLLARGLRDYAGFDAACIRSRNTYMDYPCDVEDPKYERPETQRLIKEADLAVCNAEIYFHNHALLRGKPLIVKAHGTFARSLSGWWAADHLRRGTVYVTSPCNKSLWQAVPCSLTHIPPMMDHRLLPEPSPPADRLVVGVSATKPHPFKGVDRILAALKPLEKRGLLELDYFEYMPWRGRDKDGEHQPGALDRKAGWHAAAYNVAPKGSPSHGGYGVSSVESLMLRQAVVAQPCHWVRSHFALDQPPFWDLDTFTNYIREGKPIKPDKRARKWAMKHHDIKNQIWKWYQLIMDVIETWPKPPSSYPTTPTTTSSTHPSPEPSQSKG